LLHDTVLILEECFSHWPQHVVLMQTFGVQLSDIGHITKSFVWACDRSKLSESYCRTVHVLPELLFVKFKYFFCFVFFSQADVAHVIDSICPS